MTQWAARLATAWYAPRLTALTFVLTPLSLLFAAVASARRAFYRAGLFASHRLPVPVVVVGNLTAGGSGKTPLVAALAQALATHGWRPGIVSRGYGRDEKPGASDAALLVAADADPRVVGDEPLLLARSGLPVAVGVDRVAAGRALLAAHRECNLIIADDGLQHYALLRDVEIVVVDAARGFGNGWRLPAGPLREGTRRLHTVDAVVVLTADETTPLPDIEGASRMTLQGDTLHRVAAPETTSAASEFSCARVHAVAGIGNPQRFFAQLRALGIDPIEHPYPDHHRFVATDLALPDATAILMTEKDAVKCTAFADERCWYLPVRACIDPALVARVEEKLRGSEAA